MHLLASGKFPWQKNAQVSPPLSLRLDVFVLFVCLLVFRLDLRFSTILQQVLQGLNRVDFFIDDALVWGATREEYDECLHLVLDQFKANGVPSAAREVHIPIKHAPSTIMAMC